MIKQNKWANRILLISLVLLPSILILISKLWIDIDRPLFIYDYLIILLLVAINTPLLITWVIYVLIFTLDLASIFSKIYLFNLADFLNSLKYFSNYSYNFIQAIQAIFTLLLFIFFYLLLKKIKNNLKFDIKSVIIFFTLIISMLLLDNFNGSSILMPYKSSRNFYKGNFAGCNGILLYLNIRNQNFNSSYPLKESSIGESTSYKYFKDDSIGNQMIIIVESFGFINDPLIRKEFENKISQIFESNNWQCRWGKARFSGGTTRAELRELFNSEGDYRYLLDPKHAGNRNSLIKIKKNQGYNTSAIHSFKGNMFERQLWWKNVGIENIYFSEDVQKELNFKKKLNYDTPFISANDEDAFDYIQNKVSKDKKVFLYFLTENGHLPFKGFTKETIVNENVYLKKMGSMSEEGKNQHKRIWGFLKYVAKKLNQNKIQKVVIIGDHMPPFVNKIDRAYYNDKYVPFVALKLIKK